MTVNMMGKNIKSFIAPDFIVLLSIFSLFNLQYFLKFFSFSPIHDTAVTHQIFYFFYNEFYVNNIVQLWLPHSLYGVSSDIAITTAIAPAQFFMMMVGKLLYIKNSLVLFKISLVIEGFALFVGVYLMAKRFFQHKAAIMFVCFGAIATTYWGIEISFFRMYYLIPLWLYFLIKFFDLYDFKHLWIAGIIAVISLIGDITYFAPLFLFICITFMFLLFVAKRDRAVFKAKNIFTPLSLGLLLLFLLLSFAYIDYVRQMFDYIRIYSSSRSPDGKITLGTFLTYGGKSHVMSLLEFIYAIPFSTDFFIYIGLIPLVFLIYAIFHIRGRDNPIFISMVIISIILIMFSFGLTGGIAILLYYIFPGMSYFRHIGYVKVIAKILLLIASGFGVDHYLNAYKCSGPDKEKDKLTKLSVSNISIAMLGLIIVADMAVLALKLKSNKIMYLLDNYFPYQFHFFSIFILAVFGYCLSKRFDNSKIVSRLIMLLYFIEIASYSFILSYSLPAKIPKLQGGNTVKTIVEYSKEVDWYKSAFSVRSYPFRSERVNQDKMYAIRPEMPLVLQTYMPGRFAVYFHIYSAFYVDSCLQEYRTDYMPLSFDHLIRARLGIAFDKTDIMPAIDKDHYFMKAISKDEDFMKAIGCNSSKIRFISNPIIVRNLDMAARMIRESPDLNEKPIIFESPSQRVGSADDLFKKGNPKSLDIKFDIIKFTANMLELATDTGSFDNVWLIYLDNYHPGWKAVVNGRPVSIAQADIAFKAVKLDKGHNVVKFIFENLRNKIYLTVFFIASIISSLILIISVIFLSIPYFYEYLRVRMLSWKQ